MLGMFRINFLYSDDTQSDSDNIDASKNTFCLGFGLGLGLGLGF